MKNIVIIPNITKDKDLAVTAMVAEKLNSLGFTTYISASLPEIVCAEKYREFPDLAELIIVVGGDGSVIDAAKLAVEYNIPLLGVNMGRIGYLSEVDPEMLDSLSALVTGEYFIDERMLLTVDGCSFAVNDVVISHSNYLGVSDFAITDSLGNSVSYRADGVIFATPQGSTAYSLSAGGPVIAHNVDCILATPICPHSFFNRTVIFSADEQLCVRNDSRDLMNVSFDGRIHSTIAPGATVTVTKSKSKLKMLTFSKNSMFSELFKKMSILEGLK